MTSILDHTEMIKTILSNMDITDPNVLSIRGEIREIERLYMKNKGYER